MSIFDTLFGNSKANQPNANTNPTDNAKEPTANPTPPKENKEPASPIEQFKDIWQTDPNAKPAEPVKYVDVDPTKFKEDVTKLDFSKVIKPETLQAISKGGDEAVAAFAEAINATSQATLMQSASISKKFVEEALGKADGEVNARIANNLRTSQIQQARPQDNPIYSHPATKPIAEAIELTIAQKNPTATPAEVSKLAQEYLAAFADIASTKPAAAEAKARRGEVDWSTFLTDSDFN